MAPPVLSAGLADVADATTEDTDPATEEAAEAADETAELAAEAAELIADEAAEPAEAVAVLAAAPLVGAKEEGTATETPAAEQTPARAAATPILKLLDGSQTDWELGK